MSLAASRWPRPADPDAAGRLLERFTALGPAEAAWAGSPGGGALLACLGGNSPFLADLALREHETLLLVDRAGPDATVAGALAALAAIPPTQPRSRIASAMRRAKRQVALAVAVADIGGAWRHGQVVAALSDLAEAALRLAVAHLVRALHDQGRLTLPDPADPAKGCGLTVLGMGKLGARELNYSSDVDLVLLYDPDAQPAHADGLGHLYMRVARDLVAMMEARDADGYVFRTDLRLRPDPAATPPAVNLPAAISYYESMGQNWERAAMIKARPVAGDLALGAGFLAELRPFIWRRHLDFAAVADIHAMKRRIDDHRGGPAPEELAGFNVKLGRGGIREVEFLVQTLQLVWGGRDPTVRDPTTAGGLRRLARAGHLPARAAAALWAAYRALRRVEHRLQMVADRQTHTLPAREADLERFATFMGYDGLPAFAAALLRSTEQVRGRYAAVFEQVPDAPGAVEGLVFGPLDDPPAATTAALAAMGFRDPGAIVGAVRAWRAGRPRAMRSPRARELLGAVLPGLLAALGRQSEPDAAFARLDALMFHLPTGVQLLSMFQRNPALAERVAAVLGAAPQLADHLARVPAALEGLLAPGDADPDPARTLDARLADARSLEDVVEISRALVLAEEFRLSVAQMEGRIDVDAAGIARTAMADATIAALLPRVLADHARRYGALPGGEMVVVLLGKAGGREMMAGSDLDLMLVYDHPEDAADSVGPRGVPASRWFTRAAHALVAALTAPGVSGPLYQVDMRLRPSGNKGPVAVSLPSFVRYHAHDAWTWERMALLRARVVAGSPGLRARMEGAIRAAVAPRGDDAPVRADAAAMRGRMLRDLPPTGPWDVKLRPGGLVEVEFIAQALQLIHGARSTTTREALRGLGLAGALPGDDVAMLIRADRLWRTVQSMLRITLGRASGELPAPAVEALLAAAGVGNDLPSLRAGLDLAAAEVRARFIALVGRPE